MGYGIDFVIPSSHRFPNPPSEPVDYLMCDALGNPVEIKGFSRQESVCLAA